MADKTSGTAFGQEVPPLSVYLKRVLEKYPEGGQILKELLQNADDAKARRVVFLYDKTEHPREGLWSEDLGKFQGPALYAYNDAVFKEEDWESIQKPEQSGKADDVMKVGRFGLGFISVYHLTDLPSVLSGNTIGFLDPLEQNFKFDPWTKTNYNGRRGMQWNISAELLDEFPGQFSPYLLDLFNCTEKTFRESNFKGTIFRFPFRKQSSDLSKSVFNDESRVQKLLESFQSDAEISLLFMKHIETIEVYERRCHGEPPRQVFQVQIPSAKWSQVRADRDSLWAKIMKGNCAITSELHVETRVKDKVTAVSVYVTVNTSSDTSPDLQDLIKDTDLNLRPWMGAAFKFSGAGKVEKRGRVFCFLPLPESEKSGLPVHVNGYFGLGDNRRGIKWPDKESSYDKKALWNQLLVTEVYPEVHAKLILDSIEKCKSKKKAAYKILPKDVYRAWPRINEVKKEWQDGVRKFLELLGDEKFVHTEYNGGSWMKLSEVYQDTENSGLISKVFRETRGAPLAQLPDHVVESLEWAGIDYQKVTPAIVRTRIRRNELHFLNQKEKLELLEYVTSDTIDDLSNVKLLPLQNDSFTFFSETSAHVYIETSETPSSLIPTGGRRFFAAKDLLPAALTTDEVQSYTQLRFFGREHVEQLLRTTLPASWINENGNVVYWTPGRSSQPTLQWLTKLWEWLTKNRVSLSSFAGIPLIYIKPDKIVRLTGCSMIFKKEQGFFNSNQSLTENICKFLETLGAVVIRDTLPTRVTSHPELSDFIQPSTPQGVMAILRSFSVCSILKQLERLDTDFKDELRCLMAQLRSLNSWQDVELLKELPLFRCQTRERRYTTVAMCSTAVPSNFYDIPVPCLKYNRLILRDDSDNLAVKLLGAIQETTRDFLSTNILCGVESGFYNDKTKQNVMTWVLERSEYRHLAAGVKFIPTAKTRRVVSPGDLFEPTATLKILLGQRDVFPSVAYSRERIVQQLKEVGLKSEGDLSADDILEAAKELSNIRACGPADVKRGQFLLEYINSRWNLLSENVSNEGKPLSELLIGLRWVPCVSIPPAQYPRSAGWCGESNKLYSPNCMALYDTYLLQGSVLPLLKLPDINQELLDNFSLTVQPEPNNYQTVEHVVQQLRNVSKNYNCKKDDSSVTGLAVSAIYEFLNQIFLTGSTNLKLACQKHISNIQPLVWHGSGFAILDQIAIDNGTLGVSLVPYLYTVPIEHKEKYGLFLSSIGVRQTFQEEALCNVLTNIHDKYEGGHARQDEYKGDLTLVSNILKYIVNLEHFDHLPEILVPFRSANETALHMRQASECLYVDDERLARQLDYDDLNNRNLFVIHDSISNAVAKRLELRPLSHEVAPVDQALDHAAYDIAGPSESTANAIKRNLEMYKKEDIFKELIQNADDAGATEVKFLIDWRRNEPTSGSHNLISDGMKACNGPAIWAYNDASFSREDITNICSIAAQTKRQMLDKVGRFGLGFTSVYHLTDVPSVVSGPYVLICDPRGTHLGDRIHPLQPGIKLDLTKEEHRRTVGLYPHQFHPYNGIFGCNLDQTTESYEHTLFRLPLRTSVEANDGKPNQLSDSSFDTQKEIQPLLDSLKESSETLLLFTQNVTSVEVLELKSDKVEDTETVLSVKVSRCQDIKMPRSISVPEGSTTIERNLLKATTRAMESPSSPCPSTTMIVKITRKTRPSIKSGKTKLIPVEKYFIISSCMTRRDQIEKLAFSDEGKKHGVLPCGGVAAELSYEIGGLTPKQTDGQVFSFLPLDVPTGLPFHVNGSFLLQPNRRQLWSSNPSSANCTDFTEALWNERLMKDVLCQALINLLEDLQQLSLQQIDATDFQRLWPVWDKCHSDFQPLVREYYRRVGCGGEDVPNLFYDDKKWLSVQECFFVTDSSCPIALRDSIVAILNKHSSSKRFVDLNRDVVDSIEHDCREDAFKENTYSVDRFLLEVFFPMLKQLETVDNGSLDPKHRNQITLHVLDLRLGEKKQTSYDCLLRDTDSIPTSPEGETLAKPKELVNPQKEIGQLYSEDDCRFPQGEEYRQPSRLLSLEELGMAADDLQWKDICDCAESMTHDGNSLKRSTILLKLIGKKLVQNEEPSCEQKKKILEAEFLPVLPEPEGYPSQWYKCNTKFTSASKLFGLKHTDIIGSVQPILDEEILGTEAMDKRNKSFLGFKDKAVRVEDVIRQLESLIEQPLHDQQKTSAMVCKIYSFLQAEICPNGVDGTVDVGHQAAVEQLGKMRLVFCKGNFQDIKQLAFYFNSECKATLMRVPDEFSKYKSLLSICGVRNSFGKMDFVQNLQTLHEKYTDTPVDEQDLETAKVLVNELSDWLDISSNNDGNEEIISEGKEVFVLDRKNILRPTEELTFYDMTWEGPEPRDDDRIVYTHADMPYKSAKLLGIKTATERQLESCSSSRGFERSFGQKEKLTDRLSSILKDYPNVSDVFKELLQNADDAGSTEIHFVYDHRHHKEVGVIDKIWTATQGVPALCVYNNRSFTDTDIEGIQRVGIGGKINDVTTTGRFGIGFNAVYQLTDFPSFLTNKDKLCVFDPLLKCIPGVKESSPGKMFSTTAKFREKFPGMLTGYLEDVEEFKGKEGTLFRFPLRQSRSDISREFFWSRKVDELLTDLKNFSFEALLFLNNIQKISISRIDGNTKKLCKTYTVTSSLPEGDLQQRAELAEHLQMFKNAPCDTIASKSSMHNLVIEDSERNKQTWLVSQILGFDNLRDDTQVLSNTSHLKNPLPRGGVAARIDKMPCQYTQKSEAYCFLPLRIQTRLPVHVNGMFELDTSRSNLLKGEDFVKADGATTDESFIHKWNLLLVTHVIAPAYAKLIETAGRKLLGETIPNHPFEQQIGIFNNLFPTDLEKLQGEWKVLAKETLLYIEKNSLKVLPVVCQSEDGWTVTWHDPITEKSSAVFDNLDADDESLPKGDKLGDDIPKLRCFLHRDGMNLLKSSPALGKAFQACNVDTTFVSPAVVVKHLLRTCTPSTLADTTFRDYETFLVVLKYCLKGISMPHELNGLPFGLSNAGTLRSLSDEDGLYLTKYPKVLPSEQDKFVKVDLVDLFNKWFEDNAAGTDQQEVETANPAFSCGVFTRFNITQLAHHLGKVLPADWKGSNRYVDWIPEQNGQPSETWLRDMWTFVCSEVTEANAPTCLEPLSDWPLIPTKSKKLVPPSLSATVMFLENFNDTVHRLNQVSVLQKLHLPEVELQSMISQISTQETDLKSLLQNLNSLLLNHLALPNKQNNITNVIQFMLDQGYELGSLSVSDSQVLLEYFQEGCDMLLHDSCLCIKMLSIFAMHDNKLTDLNSCENCHTAAFNEEYMVESEIWMTRMNCVFLKPCFNLIKIYEHLGITDITPADIYLQYILPCFHLLPQDAQVKLLKTIQDSVLDRASEEKQKNIIQNLTALPCILDQEGDLRTADCFYDPSNEIFKKCVPQCELLPKYMDDLKTLLKQIGLLFKVTQEMFIKFARDIETKASGISKKEDFETLKGISKLLIKLICDRWTLTFPEDWVDVEFLRKIANIQFISSLEIEKKYVEICPAFSEQGIQNNFSRPFICYRQSVLPHHKTYVWSAAMLLPHCPEYNIKMCKCKKRCKCEKIHDYLGIEQYVLERVLSHARKVCMAFGRNVVHKVPETDDKKKKKKAEDERGTACISILVFLNKKENVSKQEQIKSRLQSVSICPVEEGRVFVRADQLVFDITEDHAKLFHPYLYKTPRDLLKVEAVLKRLGAQQICTLDQLAGVLSAIKARCGDNRLGPNEWRAARYAVRDIFNLLHQKTEDQLSVSVLYLPSMAPILRKSTELLYASPNLRDHLQGKSTDKEFLIQLSQCGFAGYDEVRTIELLPDEYRPKNLGEQMLEKPCETNKDCLAGQHCGYLEHIKRMLTSEEMTRVLLRLTRHEGEGNEPPKSSTDKIEALQSFRNLSCKTQLRTGWYDKDGKLEISQPYTSKAFFEKGNNMFHLEHCDLPSMHHTSHTFKQVADSLNHLLRGLLNPEHVSYLQSALDSKNPADMNGKLSESSIPEYDDDDIASEGTSEGHYKLGTIVPSDIRHFLDQDPYNRFDKDEIVGYERNIGGMHHDNLDTATEIIFARIEEEIDQSEETVSLSRKFKIDIGEDEHLIVSVITLFKFLAPREPEPEQATVPFTGECTTEAPEALPAYTDATLEEVLERDREQIRQEVEEAFKLQEEDRKKVLHRLFRRWHPDKNHGQEERTTEAFKFLQAEIKRRESGSHFSDNFPFWESEARRDSEYQRGYFRSWRGRGRRGPRRNRTGRTFVPPSFTGERPNPRNARLWFRQAEEHFANANQTNRLVPGHIQWVVFQAHQAAEVALKAAQFGLNGEADLQIHDLVSLATAMGSSQLVDKARELENLECQFNKPRYPQSSTLRTSREVYEGISAVDVLGICEELLSIVREMIGIRGSTAS